MKKRIFCGSAALLMTGLTVSVLTTAAPRLDREIAIQALAPQARTVVAAVEVDRILIGSIEVRGSRHES